MDFYTKSRDIDWVKERGIILIVHSKRKEMALKNLKAHLCSYFNISPLSIHSRIYDFLIQMVSLCCYLMSIQEKQNLKSWKLAWNCELSPGVESWLLKMSARFSSWVQSQNHGKVVRLIHIPEAAESTFAKEIS